GVAFGLSDFWQRHPTALEIEGMTREVAKVTLWLWSPDAPPMDVRHYDTRGHSLNATYEDHEEGHSTPLGVARTSELTLALLANTPSREQFAKSAQAHQQRPLLVCAPSYYHNLRAFGLWSLPDRGTPAKARLEEELDQAVAFYQKETEQRQWFGFWNYGDFMHSYDRVRHTWRYDVGGFAWANSELVPDLWLWYFFLRSGRADVFKMAEAMTRHTGEVDVHHIGPFAGLGSRHNVSHWGCGSKEARISQAGLRRMFFYLTADERVGDLMRAEVDSDFATVATDPLRKILPKSVYPTHARVGPDWFSFVSNWLVEWERTGDVRYRDKIITGMKCIAAMPRGLFTGAAFGYDPKTSKLFMLDDKVPGDSHLVSIFGGAELCFELAALIDEPEWDRAWLQYCELYNVPGSDRARTLGGDGGGKNGSFSEWHARLTAYVGWRRKDLRLVRRAWEEFFKGQGQSDDQRYPLKPKRVQGPDVLLPIDEISWISTNEISQWSLNAIELLELAGDVLPA
ncbi:MAG TPA: Tat pathway signal sequence domain protein, partial [Opitutaceae bacterium]|nr:Tat pathway signal sequence domain protein [Opitutaceae bacterium]